MNIFLHQDDLRIHDNVGLKRASEDGKVLPVYVEDPRIKGRTGENKQVFRNRGIRRLAETYESRNSGLKYRKGKTAEKLAQVIDGVDAEKVFFNRGYSPARREAQQEVEKLDVETRSFKDRLMVEPKELQREYGTFSQFYDDWKKVENQEPVGEPDKLADTESDIPELETGTNTEIPVSGEKAAIETWERFREEKLENYRDERDNLAEPGAVSRMSAYYSSGMIGLRTVVENVESLIEKSDDSSKIRNYAKYRSELAWREFFYQVLYFNPGSLRHNYRDIPNRIEWKNDQEELEAWKKGETGVPLVDAGIREMRNTGYMHNRTRQNVASFLTKHLMVDWRKGAEFFQEHLVDHDPASNAGGWQWAASTGTDSVSVRIFNPVKQGRKYDPEAEYMKRWLPELEELAPEEIQSWVEMSDSEREEMEVDYPHPIINFNRRYHQGRKMFERALGK